VLMERSMVGKIEENGVGVKIKWFCAKINKRSGMAL